PAHAPHHLAQRRVVEVAQARPVARVGQEQVPQPGGTRLRLQFLQQRRLLPVISLLQLRVEALLIRVDVLVHEGRQPTTVLATAPTEFEIHAAFSSPGGRLTRRRNPYPRAPDAPAAARA